MNTSLQKTVGMGFLVALSAVALMPFAARADYYDAYFEYANYGYGDSYVSASYENDDFGFYYSNKPYYYGNYYGNYFYVDYYQSSYGGSGYGGRGSAYLPNVSVTPENRPASSSTYHPQSITVTPLSGSGYPNTTTWPDRPYHAQSIEVIPLSGSGYPAGTGTARAATSNYSNSASQVIADSYTGPITVSSGRSLKSIPLTPVSQTSVSYHPVNYTYSYPYDYSYNNQYNNQYPYNYGYNYPNYNYSYTQPSCSLSITYGTYSGGAGYNQATVSWSSQNATSASISPDIGPVPTSGSRVVYAPQYNQSYTMTVYGPGGSANCYASGGGYYTYPGYTTYPNYTYPSPSTQYGYNYAMPTPTITTTTSAPYVSLTQIPYTGFDLGPLGNSLYWLAIIAFAALGAYLIVYYRGGAFALAGQMISFPSRPRTMRAQASTVLPTLPVLKADTEEDEPVRPEMEPERASTAKDTMSLARTTGDEMPRIVINRS